MLVGEVCFLEIFFFVRLSYKLGTGHFLCGDVMVFLCVYHI